jgi:hypothetical protein
LCEEKHLEYLEPNLGSQAHHQHLDYWRGMNQHGCAKVNWNIEEKKTYSDEQKTENLYACHACNKTKADNIKEMKTKCVNKAWI